MKKMVAFIPVRGGSKSIPLKNIKEINGKPLVFWTISAAVNAPMIDEVYVATDSPEIVEVVHGFGFDKVKVIGRSLETATDTATTESVMLEFAVSHEFEDIVLIQATSPLLKAEDINKGVELYRKEEVDSVLSVVRQKRFIWEKDGDSYSPVNYDVFHRPRRQEFEGFLVENGAFYITSKEALIRTRNRISGRIKAVEMDEATYIEIDEPNDWMIVEGLMKK